MDSDGSYRASESVTLVLYSGQLAYPSVGFRPRDICPVGTILISAETAVLRLRTRGGASELTVTGHGTHGYRMQEQNAKGQRGLQSLSLGKCQVPCVLAARTLVQNLSQSQVISVHSQV